LTISIYDYLLGSSSVVLYIPQGHYLISTLWLCSTDEYDYFFILIKSPPLSSKMTWCSLRAECERVLYLLGELTALQFTLHTFNKTDT